MSLAGLVSRVSWAGSVSLVSLGQMDLAGLAGLAGSARPVGFLGLGLVGVPSMRPGMEELAP